MQSTTINTKQAHRTKLNQDQLALLKTLYKFRFGSKVLVTEYLGKKDQSSVFRRLENLVDQDLVAKRYDSSYKLQGKPAAYYLTPTGARALQAHLDEELNIKLLYKSKDVSEDFIVQSLTLFQIGNDLVKRHGKALRFYTKSDLAKYDYFPQPLPNAYIRLESRQYFVEVLKASDPPFVIKRHIQRYLTYARESNWEDTGTHLPAIILVCDTDALQKRVNKLLAKNTDDIDLEDLQFIVTIEPAKVI